MNDLPVYLMHDQPHCCPKCGLRTSFEETPDGAQLHECTCGYVFRVEEEKFVLDPGAREKVIDALIEDWMYTIRHDTDYARSILLHGHTPMSEWTDTELVEAYRDAFDEDPAQ